MYNSYDVALRLLSHARSQGKTVTNLQLQKLVYIAHGLMLGAYKKSLLSEEVSAWQYGPVIPSLYHFFKGNGDRVIQTIDETPALDDEAESAISNAVRLFGEYTGSQLVSLTHRPKSPWYDIWHNNISTIPNAVIQKHYAYILSTQNLVAL